MKSNDTVQGKVHAMTNPVKDKIKMTIQMRKKQQIIEIYMIRTTTAHFTFLTDHQLYTRTNFGHLLQNSLYDANRFVQVGQQC